MEASKLEASDASTPIPIPSRDETSDEPISVPFSWGTGSAPSAPAADTDEESSVADYDSAIGGLSNMSSMISLRSSIYEDVVENGRKYHRYKQGKYPLPNDEQEQKRLDLQHMLFDVTLSGHLYLAPITDPKNVLDFATGTGIWAIDFAQQHPNSNVLGTDLSAIQPLYVPPNLRFEINDAEDEWNFSEPFDYIHARAVATCFTDPRRQIQQAYNSLVPGGYLEIQDGTFPFRYIGDPPVDSALYKWNQLVVEGAAKSGRPWTNAPNYHRWFQELGFVDVVEKHFYWPTSPWPKGKYFKSCAIYWQEDLLSGLEAISLRVMGNLGWTKEEVEAFLPDVRRDIKDTAIKAYFPINVVYGRKTS